MDRSNWSDAINMVANVQKLLTDHDVNVTMVGPRHRGRYEALGPFIPECRRPHLAKASIKSI